MDILNLPPLDPNLMTIGIIPNRIKRAQHIHRPDRLVNHIPPHSIILRAPALRQAHPTRLRKLRPLHPLTVRTPLQTARGILIRPHIQIPIAVLLECLAARPVRSSNGRPALLLDELEGFLSVEEQRPGRRGNGIDQRDGRGVIPRVAQLRSQDVRLSAAGGGDDEGVAGAGDDVGGRARVVDLERGGEGPGLGEVGLFVVLLVGEVCSGELEARERAGGDGRDVAGGCGEEAFARAFGRDGRGAG